MRFSPRTLAAASALTALILAGATFGAALPALASDEPVDVVETLPDPATAPEESPADAPEELPVDVPDEEALSVESEEAPSFTVSSFALAGPAVTAETQKYDPKNGQPRTAVTLTFDVVVNTLPQGWYGDGTGLKWTKVFFSDTDYTATFKDANGVDGSYSSHVDLTAPTVTHTQQDYENKENGRVRVTLTFSEIIDPSLLGQGWYGSGTVYNKVFYSTKDVQLSFTDLIGIPGSYLLHVLYAPPVLQCTATDTIAVNESNYVSTFPRRDPDTFDSYPTSTGNGTADFTAGGVVFSTPASTDRVRWLHPVNLGLAYLGSGALTASGGSLQATIDFDGNGSIDGGVYSNGVYEWTADGNVNGGTQAWLDAHGAPAALITNTTNKYTGTNQEWLTAFPNAKIREIGIAAGRFAPLTTTFSSATVACTTFTFAATPPVVLPVTTAPTDLAPVGLISHDGDPATWEPAINAVKYQTRIAATEAALAGSTVYGDFDCNPLPGTTTCVLGGNPLPDGSWYWQVRGLDSSGAPGPWSEVAFVTVDTTAPAVPSPTFPAGFTLTADHFAWSPVTDDHGPVTYEVLLGSHPNTTDGRLNDGVVVALTDAELTSQDFDFPTGPLQWQVRAIDSLGNASAWSTPTGAQVIGVPEIVFPTPALQFSSATLTAQWTPSFGVGGVARYEIEYGLDRDHDGTLAYEYREAAGTNNWTGDLVTRTQSFTSGYEGPLTIRVRAIYNIPIGGSAVGPWSDTVSYLRDTAKPAITIDTPAAGARLKGDAAIPVTITGTDAAGVRRLVANLYEADGTTFIGPIGSTAPNGALGQSATRTWNIPAGLAEGGYVIRASAQDAAGKTTATSISIVIDRTRPTVTIDVPAPGTVFNTDVTVTVTGLDPNGIASLGANLYNAGNANPLLRSIGTATATPGATTMTATWTIPISWFATDGTYTIRAGGFDLAGNNRTVTAQFSVDRTGPAAPQPFNPENGRMQSDSTPLLDWNPVTDTVSNPVSYDVRTSRSPGRAPNANDGELNGSDAATVIGITDTEYQLGPQADGWLWWQVRAVDALGNTGPWSNIWATGIDTIDPVVTLLTPADGDTLTSHDFSLTWSASETNVTYDIQSSLDPTVDPATGMLGDVIDTLTGRTPAFLALVGVPDEVYYWQVRATDAAGNVGDWTSPFEVTVDADPDVDLPTGSPEGEGGETPAGTPAGTAGRGTTTAGAAAPQLTTFALDDEETDTSDEPSGAPADDENADPESAGATEPAGFDAGLLWLFIAIFVALLLLLGVFIAWMRRRAQED